MQISVSANGRGVAVWQYVLSIFEALGLIDSTPDPKSRSPPKNV